MTRVVILGGGPAGYEAALVAAQLGAQVTLVERDGLGGSCVLYDCVPSKTFIVSANAATTFRDGDAVGVMACEAEDVKVNAPAVHGRVRGLALAQSSDIRAKMLDAGVELVRAQARLVPGAASHLQRVEFDEGQGHIDAQVVLIATGASPRVLPGAEPDGERILTWRQVYDLAELPEELVIVGSGVTGAEFASAYQAMGTKVTLIASRDRVMPHEDSDAANLIEHVFNKRGMTLLYNGRATSVRREGSGVVVELADGRVVRGSHALMTVGSVPNTDGLGLAEAGVECGPGGHVKVDRVSRTSVPGVYAAGDCTGLLPLASVAAMQGRIAMWHALGEAVAPLKLNTVAANVFTDPEMATVGVGQSTVEAGLVPARSVMLPLATNARAKMTGFDDGFVKLYCRPASGLVIGGVVVGPRASELILPIAMAVQNKLTVQQIAQTIAIYPSLSGSITEAARQLIEYETD
ncbi:MAG: NAD(P)H-quinone dehydrogenase [Corynebacteriales bacterium]|nr:NAD(P)H-quinone dehydrogenase [Mycobacteriales bacterium]